ncbi:MAG: NUDIX domain-containing protein, partial [Actinobacteria bacterium]|nr:NUDIX domain-containing protein [Actinomycetota bacterium]
PETCALRELEEELGLTAKKLTHMATFYSTPGFCDETMHMFLAEELTPGENSLEREEFIEPQTRTLEPVDDLARELADAKSLVGVLLAHQVVINRR